MSAQCLARCPVTVLWHLAHSCWEAEWLRELQSEQVDIRLGWDGKLVLHKKIDLKLIYDQQLICTLYL